MKNHPSSSKLNLPIMLTTAEAAKALNRRLQTLQKWACLSTGVLKPVRINGRLAWPADDILAILNSTTIKVDSHA
jgi:hypothetical protein